MSKLTTLFLGGGGGRFPLFPGGGGGRFPLFPFGGGGPPRCGSRIVRSTRVSEMGIGVVDARVLKKRRMRVADLAVSCILKK